MLAGGASRGGVRGGRAAGVGGVVRGAVPDDDAAFVWALSAGSVTLTVLVLLQAVWVKSVWLDLWR